MKIEVADLQNKIDFGIITIREDEFLSVYDRLQPSDSCHGRRIYDVGKIYNTNKSGFYRYALVRIPSQGENAAQDCARDLIEDFYPKMLLLVGIGGAVPSLDFTLGDVVCATRVYDFSVRATKEGVPDRFSAAGGPMHRRVENILGRLPAIERQLKDWNSEDSISLSVPSLKIPPKGSDRYYGSKDWQNEVRNSLIHHFNGNIPHKPQVTARPVASSDSLIKDTNLLNQWLTEARAVAGVEMELGGIYFAARRSDKEYPILAIRGISDIVGFKRDDAWTKYACNSAGAFAVALIKSGELLSFQSEEVAFTSTSDKSRKYNTKAAPSKAPKKASKGHNRPKALVSKKPTNHSYKVDPEESIQILQTRYLDCLDSSRFSSKVSYHNVRLLRLIYVKAQFLLAIISGDNIVATENQVLDSLGFLETFDEIHEAVKKSKVEDLPVSLALRPSNASIYESVAKNLEKESKSYTLSLWDDLNTDTDRRQEWARAIKSHKKPSGKNIVFDTEKGLLNKLWHALEYFDHQRCVPAKDVPEEFANRLEQIVSLDDVMLDEMRSQKFHERLYISKQGVFTSTEEVDAAKTLTKMIRDIRNRVNRRITSRTIVRDAIKELNCDQDIKDGLYELIDGIYNQVLGIASSASIVQSSNFQEQTQPHIKAGYALAGFIQETNNSHFHNMYVPWEIFEYDGLEGADKIDKDMLEAIAKSIPWQGLLKLNSDQSWRNSLFEYKSFLSSLQKIDELLATEDRIGSQELIDEHNTTQNNLGKAWSKHIDNTRRLIPNSPWGFTDSRIFFLISMDKKSKPRQLPFFISYSHFKTKRDITKDEMYQKWQKNLSFKGRMDARSSSLSLD